MNVVINGREERVDGPCTVEQLLVQRDLSGAPCAVEVNTELVPKAHHGDHLLDEGDHVEIVTLVGGG